MASITLKNIPDPLYRALKRSAELHHRSINGEVIYRLEVALMPHEESRRRALEELDNMRNEIGAGVALSPAEIRSAIEEERE